MAASRSRSARLNEFLGGLLYRGVMELVGVHFRFAHASRLRQVA